MQCVHVLMEGTPDHIELGELRKKIFAVEGVRDLHDLHVWTIASGLHAMSAHVLVADGIDAQQVLHNIAEVLRTRLQNQSHDNSSRILSTVTRRSANEQTHALSNHADFAYTGR